GCGQRCAHRGRGRAPAVRTRDPAGRTHPVPGRDAMNGTRRLMTRAARGSAGDRPASLATLLLAVAAIPPHAAAADPEPHAEPARMIVVALPELPDPLVEPGSTPRGYGSLPGYSGSQRGRAEAAALAREYGLREVSAWTIA